MGTKARKRSPGGLADALFTTVQQRVLGLLFASPDRAFGSAELIRRAGSGTGAAHRQLQRLEKAGLVRSKRIGNQKQYQANRDSPIFAELHGLIVKTVGLVEPLRAALTSVAKQIDLAFVFGSVAKGSERTGSDLDLLVVSYTLTYPEIYETVLGVEETLGRQIQPTVMTRADWAKRRSARDSFTKRIAEQPKLFVIGRADDLA